MCRDCVARVDACYFLCACVCVCVRACVRACARACVRVCVRVKKKTGGGVRILRSAAVSCARDEHMNTICTRKNTRSIQGVYEYVS